MQLSKDFSFEELIRSRTALRLNLENIPDEKQKKALQYLVNTLLQPTRNKFGGVISINRGFSTPEVNKAIGGAEKSQHINGEAADIESNDNARLFSLIRSFCNFDQLIWEFGDDNQPDWIHVSVVDESVKGKKNRREVLKSVKKDGKTEYIKL